jgi:hypothetical protein
MTIRTTSLILAGGVLGAALATGAPANADAWRFV